MTRVRVRKIAPDVYLGSLTLDSPDCGGVGDTGGDGVISVGAFGASQADALHKTALLAERIINDPVMSMIIPPQARAAVIATKKLGAAAKRGSRFFRKLWRSYSGPGTKRIAKALHDEAMRREGHSDAEVGAFWDTVKKVAKKAAKYSAPGLIYRGAKAVKRKVMKKKPRVKVIPPREQPDEPPQYDEQAPQYDEPDGTDTAPGGVEVIPADNGYEGSDAQAMDEQTWDADEDADNGEESEQP
jgi:hypothetical protein